MYQYIKRLFDIILSLVALIILAPLIFITTIIVKSTSKGPVFFKGSRIGYNGKPFSVIKFRTMFIEADPIMHNEYIMNLTNKGLGAKRGNEIFKLKNDPRITQVGRFLRRYGLDELPQFINVLKGNMSFIGPRPPIKFEYEAYKDLQDERLKVKPGITGLWQVSGRNILTYDRMIELDLYYIKNISFILDLKILIRSIFAPFKGYGAL